ncbi:proteasome ATPase [Bifidobacterium vespertilionis]|uniref:AAA ATPase forming ring-shaped complexes n=1 Tax=Bifidobacterium vespertilionis TaxID=2562524 RepID=A0A5J5DZ55_9BIFI|nr:proteasome ATPase [Bifidobacterium vespertilionis]KAA8822105.1 proteasome ATPase [Bifidobacterium vespertilionis]KAA8824532.1 proteasome ATPase [Bifidobacterium vespertilionis]
MTEVEKLADQLDRLQAKNHALAQALNRASQELGKAKSQLVQLAQPPKTFATMVKVDQVMVDDDGVQHASAEVVNGPRRMVVPVAPTVNAARLACGQTVLLNENLVLVEQRETPVTGLVRVVEDPLDAARLLVRDQSGSLSVVRRSSALTTAPVKRGDRVLTDANNLIALEALPPEDDGDLVLEETPDVTFEDIGGLEGQIGRIRDAVQLPFRHRELFRRYDLRPPKGVLLYGPPGNGKTMIAKAVAHSLSDATPGVNGVFLSVKGPELLNKYVGESERLIRLIFARARERAAGGRPVIVFIDEMDSLLRTRGSGVSSDVETTIVPQFLSELDGVESLDNVIVIGASNRVDMIDPAVLRPGRLDVKIRIDRPGAEQAASILRHYVTDDLPLAPGLDVDALVGNVVRDAYARDDSRHVCDVRRRNGDWDGIYFADVISGATLKNIVDRAKTRAVKASIETGSEVALNATIFGRAVDEEFRETADAIANTDPAQWSRITGLENGQVAEIRSVVA